MLMRESGPLISALEVIILVSTILSFVAHKLLEEIIVYSVIHNCVFLFREEKDDTSIRTKVPDVKPRLKMPY